MGKRAKWMWGLMAIILLGGLAVWRYGHPHSSVVSDKTKTTRRVTQSGRINHPQISQSRLMAGVIEGFYGPQWSYAETKQMFGFMQREGLNTFVYAPKNSPYLRAQWNRLYPSNKLKGIAGLVHAAERDHIQFVCSISPGLSIDYGSAKDQGELEAKINQLWSVGIHSFMVSFDDIPPQLPPSQAGEYHNNLALAQAQLVNKIYVEERKKDHMLTMLFTPTAYWGLNNNTYWNTLKMDLNAKIPVIWTGPGVLSKTITQQQVLTVKHDMGHSLIIWDNYPVNDYTYVMEHHPQLFMGPLMGRDAQVLSAVRGYLFNPMLQPYASELALATGASYLRHPLTYRPQQAWLHELALWKEPTGKALQSFAGANSVSYLNTEPLDQLNSHMKSFWQSYAGHKNLMGSALYKQFVRWNDSSAILRDHLPSPYYDEIRPWLNIYRQEAQLGMHVSAALAHPQLTSASLTRQLITEQNRINGSAYRLGVHVMLQSWFAKAFRQPPFVLR